MYDNNKKAIIVAYYISKYDVTALTHLGFKSWNECFYNVHSVLDINVNSIRQMRDEFDAIHDNPRVGHKKDKLGPSRQEVVDEFGSFDEVELRNIVLSFIDTSHSSNEGILKNLSELAEKLKRYYLDDFQEGDVILTDNFKQKFGVFIRDKGDNIVFYNTTSMITTAGNKKIYAPNQWYVIAEYMVEYAIELFRYKEHLECIFEKMDFNTEERKDYIKQMKAGAAEEEKSNFTNECLSYFSENGDKDAINENANFMTRFITDYNWWHGSKTIDRGDFYITPVLALLNVINNTQSYIADICYFYAHNEELYMAEKKLVEMASESINAFTHPGNNVSSASGVYNATYSTPRLTNGKNLIVYGAPGTGKSRYLEDLFGRENRVVFHQEYTYFDFVGSYKPVPLYKEGVDLKTISGESFAYGEPVIDYQFVPGPFLTVFIKAWLNPGKMYTLLIEEINRANAASVFGEVFQLLDRTSDGSGEYSIIPSKELLNYLLSIEKMKPYITNGLLMPSNMNIVATMNSADQGVTLLDAAFKRRWEFEYLKIAVSGAVHEKYLLQYGGKRVYWGDLVTAINDKLKEMRVEEDRLVGPYFIRPDEVGKSAATYKILLYLWDDVLRHRRDQFFSTSIRTFSDLVDNFTKSDVLQLNEFINLESPAIDVEENLSDEPEENSDINNVEENIN